MPAALRRSRPKLLLRGAFLSCLFILLLAGLSVEAAAKEYSVETVLRAGGEVDDNVQLQEEETSIAGVVISPELNLGVRTERLDVALNTALDFARFDKSEYNSDDQDVALASSYAFEYNVFNATAQLVRDSTRTSEALDTGAFGEASRRELQNLSLGWKHLLTDKQSLEMSATYVNVDYSSTTNRNLNDYEYSGLGVAYSVDLSARTRLISQLEVSRFESNTLRLVQFGLFGTALEAALLSSEIQSDTYGFNVGVERVVTEKLRYSIAVGANYVESSYDSPSAEIAVTQSPLDLELISGLQDEDDTAFYFNSTLSYEGERSTLTGRLSSNTNPSANGYLLLANQLSFDFDYRITERSDASLKLELIDSQSLGETVDSLGRPINSNDRTYGAATVRASYRLTKAWYISAAFRYRAQDREAFDDAQSNAVLLQIAYKPRKNTWSR